jgi:peptidoglycan/LPS O-acetylase OafA/YrhL
VLSARSRSRPQADDRESGFRPDIQALRALAVAVVVVYHFWPHLLPGGFVGVDVFFVISGFLITSHLVSEIRRTGRLSLPAFWARRARRLLPASLLVLAVTGLASAALLSAGQWQQVFKEIVASALYVQNWVLAFDSIDYLAAENAPTPVQHFWSLSVEEQFYIVIPILLVLAVALFGRRDAAARDRIVVGALGLAVLVSLAYSLYATFTSPGLAYFSTVTRAWEFAAGGLLAFVVTKRLPAAVLAGLAWLGWIGVAVSSLVITGDTPFPGIAALAPVAASAAVLIGGRSGARWAPDRLLATRPTVWLGDVSYSTYLWHWPVLILAGAVLGDDLRWGVKLGLIAVVLALAWATTRFVENPTRSAPLLVSRRPRATFAALALAMALVVAPALGAWQAARHAAAVEVAAAAALAERAADCFGAGVRLTTHDCSDVEFDGLVPTPSAARDDRVGAYADGCHTPNNSDEVPACVFGDADGVHRVALVGDSHAVNWLPALDRLGRERGWQVVLLTRAACPFNLATQVFDTAASIESCASWKRNVIDYLDGQEPFDVVFSAHFVGAAEFAGGESEGVRLAWAQLLDRSSRVVILRDVPRASEATTDCLERNENDSAACDRSIQDALPVDDYVTLAGQTDRVDVIDLSDVFCWDGTCKAAIGGVTVYRDGHHLTVTFSTTLAPLLAQQADRLGLPMGGAG